MKSDNEQLERRGFLPKDFNTDAYDLSFNEKLGLLKSKIPTDRILAAILLKNETNAEDGIEHLIKSLGMEKKLYPKICLLSDFAI